MVLKIKIMLDHYTMKLPNGTLTGKMEDYFEGIIIENSSALQLDWRSYGWLDGASDPPIDVIKANPVKVIFTKIKFD